MRRRIARVLATVERFTVNTLSGYSADCEIAADTFRTIEKTFSARLETCGEEEKGEGRVAAAFSFRALPAVGHSDFDTTIALPALSRGVVGHRCLLAVTPGIQA